MTLWRAHNLNMPQLPTDINFHIPTEFSTTTDDQPFILLDHSYAKRTKRILMFSSEKQFKVMCESSAIYIDGTFAVTPRQFKQTYIVQAHDIESEKGKFMLKRKYSFSKIFVSLALFHSSTGGLDSVERQKRSNI
jgi:hypothetical protein